MVAKRPQKKSAASGKGPAGKSGASGKSGKPGKPGKSKTPDRTLTRLVIGIMGVLCLAFTVLAGYWLWQGGGDSTRRSGTESSEARKSRPASPPQAQRPAGASRPAGLPGEGAAKDANGNSGRSDAQGQGKSSSSSASRTGQESGSATAVAPPPDSDGTGDADGPKGRSARSGGAYAEGDGAVRGPVSPDALPYEEALDAPLEEGVKQVDYALVQTLVRLGVDRDRLRILGVETRSEKGETYHFQRMRLNLGGTPERFVKAFGEALPVWAERARMNRRADDLIEVQVGGVPTHEIELSLFESEDEPRPVPPRGGARLVIVIDDIGESMGAVRDLAALDYPVTFAVWPRSTHAREAAEAAHKAGREVMIHQPMEPVKYPSVKPGPGALYVRMSASEIEATLRDNLRRVPHAVGLNNHMGSRFTQDVRGVRAVCAALEGRGLFVLDSVTHSDSVFYREGRRAGLPAEKRSVFLDVIHDRRNIIFQLDKAARVAHAQGRAVAIGHPLPETIAALKEWGRTRDRSVQIITMRQLLSAEAEAEQ